MILASRLTDDRVVVGGERSCGACRASGARGEHQRRAWGCDAPTIEPQAHLRAGADGQPVTWFRCPLAVLRDEPHLSDWITWAARYHGAFSNGGLSPFDMDRRFSAVAHEAFGLWSKGQSDSFKEARSDHGGPRPGKR